MIVLIILLSSISCQFSKELPEIALFEGETLSLNLYNYFPGEYLEFFTNSSSASVPDHYSLEIVFEYDYLYDYENNFTSYSTFANWINENYFYIIDYVNDTLYFFDASLNYPMTIITSYKLNYTIDQVVMFEPSKELIFAIVLAHSDINLLVLLNLTTFSSKNSNIDIQEIFLWDLYYVEGLKTCPINGTNFIPFIGNLFDNGIVIIYDFTNASYPKLVQYFNSYSGIFDLLFLPIDIASVNSVYFKPVFAILDLSSTVMFLAYEYHSFQPDLSIILSEYGAAYSLNTIQSVYYIKNIEVYGILMVATDHGLVLINYDKSTQMFYVTSPRDPNLSPVKALQAIGINNIYFTLLETGQIMIAEDNLSTQNKIYCINTTLSDINNNNTIKWTIIYNFNSYFYIQSSSSMIQAYNLSFNEPILHLKGISNEIINITAFNLNGNSTEIFFSLVVYESFNTILPIREYTVYDIQMTTVEVNFKGFFANASINAYEYVSGRNTSFDVELQLENPYFTVDYYTAKVTPTGNPYLNKSYNRIVAAESYYVAIYDEGVDFYDMNLNKTIFALKITNIIEVVSYEDFTFFSYYDKNSAYILRYPNPQKIKTNDKCLHLQAAEIYLFCGGANFLTIFSCLEFCKEKYTTSFESPNELQSMSVSYNPLGVFPIILYILNNNHELFLNPLSIILAFGINLDKKFLTLPNCFFIKASSTQVYAILLNSIEVYTVFLEYIRTIPLVTYAGLAFILKDFLYIINDFNYLIIIDGKQTVMNSYYYETSIDENCFFSSAWGYKNDAYYGLLCSEGKNHTFEIYYTKCPIFGKDAPCNHNINFFIYLAAPLDALDGLYYQNVTINALNQFSNISFNISLELITFGQAAALTPFANLSGMNYPYNFPLTVDMRGVFLGNDLNYSITLNNFTSNISQCCDPIMINQIIEEFAIFNYTEKILSITSIPYTNFIIASLNNGTLIIIDSSELNTENQIKGYYNLSEYTNYNNIKCESIQSVSNINNITLIVASCSYFEKIPYYFQGSFIHSATILKGVPLVLIFNISSFTLGYTTGLPLNIMLKFLKVITNDMYTFNVIYVSSILTNTTKYVNNYMYIVNMVWDGFSICSFSSEYVTMFSLGLKSLTIMSIDGFFYDTFYAVVADYWNGILILQQNNSVTKVIHNINNNDNDPVISIGTIYKGFNAISKSGALTTYYFTIDMAPNFFTRRNPFTINSYNISSVQSYVVTSNFYYSRYLAYPVVYNNGDVYYRIVDTMIDFSNYLIKDLYAQKLYDDKLEGVYYATFINNSYFCFPTNQTKIVFYSLNSLMLTMKGLTKSEYNQMKNKWNNNNFVVKVIAENPNNYANISFSLNLTGPTSSNGDEDYGIKAWMFIVIVVSMCIVLAITVKLVHKFVFKRRNTVRIENESSQYERIIHF